MRKKTTFFKKGVALLLSAAMAVTIVPVMDAPKKAKAASDKTVAGLGTSAIHNPTSTTEYATAWAGSYVYYG
ncbi:MAG: hypothetical protein IJ733_15585, partial [Lachnospiraceae bacterium]|nr:hypothetical protein [Lachnospiraceae bacterium]